MSNQITGKVRRGYCGYAPHVIVEIDEDGTETYGLLGEKGELIPFTKEEFEDFDRTYRWRRTKIFDKKYENNVIPFPARKPPVT